MIYVTSIDSVVTEVSGQIYLDDSEYIQRDSVFTSSNIELSTVFEFEVNVLSADSIMFKKNTDCNQDGIYTEWYNQTKDNPNFKMKRIKNTRYFHAIAIKTIKPGEELIGKYMMNKKTENVI